MRAELRRTGGFAATTTANAVVLDTTTLSPAQAETVERTVAAARASRSADGRGSGGADLIHYMVTITDDPARAGVADALSFEDPIPDLALADLVDVILDLGQVRT